MLKKILLVLAVLLCTKMSDVPAMAVYSGFTDTVENVIQLLEKEGERSVVYQVKIHTHSNAVVQDEFYDHSTAWEQEIISTDSNASEPVQTCTDSNSDRI